MTFKIYIPCTGAFRYIQYSDHTLTGVEEEVYRLYFGREKQKKL
ncbi:ZinT/AdcA family metal-binding protein [Enterococcus sp. BWT-B8]|nr:ZinT/AdcA family metal-binding protein [Enterococcus sp. BWT-B8]